MPCHGILKVVWMLANLSNVAEIVRLIALAGELAEDVGGGQNGGVFEEGGAGPTREILPLVIRRGQSWLTFELNEGVGKRVYRLPSGP